MRPISRCKRYRSKSYRKYIRSVLNNYEDYVILRSRHEFHSYDTYYWYRYIL